jgi:hypothetical protein
LIINRHHKNHENVSDEGILTLGILAFAFERSMSVPSAVFSAWPVSTSSFSPCSCVGRFRQLESSKSLETARLAQVQQNNNSIISRDDNLQNFDVKKILEKNVF